MKGAYQRLNDDDQGVMSALDEVIGPTRDENPLDQWKGKDTSKTAAALFFLSNPYGSHTIAYAPRTTLISP